MKKKKRQEKSKSISTYFKSISNKDKVILCVTSSIIVVFMSFSYIFLPSLDSYLIAKDKISELENEKSKFKIYQKQNTDLKGKVAEIQKVYDKVVSELPKTPQTALILKDVEQMALLASVNMKSISVSEPEDVNIDYLGEVDRGIDKKGEAPDEKIEDKDKIKKQSLFLSVEGDYEKVKAFINAIENYNRISEVSDISIVKIDKTVEVEVKPQQKPESNNTTTNDNNNNSNNTGSNNTNSEDNKPKFETVKVGETLSVSLTANFYNLNYEEKEQYDFNVGNYGKENSFK